MAVKKIQGNDNLAKQIRSRRNELGLTIEEAASKAGVGTKTWSRYEAGESIRADKCKGICKALNWYALPGENNYDDDILHISDYKNHKAWSSFLENVYGEKAALSFAVGSDLLYDHIKEDLSCLSSMPKGTHIGQLDCSMLVDDLPEQFVMYYDYDFLYLMKCTLHELIMRANMGLPMTAHSILEELLIYLCNEEAMAFIELFSGIECLNSDSDEFYFEDWIFDMFNDSDILIFLYANKYINSDHMYHFNNWPENQFYMDIN